MSNVDTCWVPPKHFSKENPPDDRLHTEAQGMTEGRLPAQELAIIRPRKHGSGKLLGTALRKPAG